MSAMSNLRRSMVLELGCMSLSISQVVGQASRVHCIVIRQGILLSIEEGGPILFHFLPPQFGIAEKLSSLSKETRSIHSFAPISLYPSPQSGDHDGGDQTHRCSRSQLPIARDGIES